MRFFRDLSVRTICFLLLAALSAVWQVNNAQAADIGSLTVRDQNGRSVVLSEKQILALPRHKIETSTAWTEGKHVFEGVALGNLLSVAGINYKNAQNKFLQLNALNDYLIDIPLEDVQKYNPLVAAFMDGQRLNVRDKGPYWLIYPRDEYEELQDSRYDHRWTWQLKEITLE